MTPWVPLLVAGALLGGYVLTLACRPATLPAWSSWRTIAWTAGALLVALAVGPLNEAAHHDHRYHMAQHLLLGMYAPLGLALGAPLTLLLGSLPRRHRPGLARVLRSRPLHLLVHPVTAAVLTVGGMFILYRTPLYALSMSSQVAHWLVMAHFLLAGCLYTWAIAGPDPAPNRPGMATRTTVLVLAAGSHAFLAKLLYAEAPTLVAGHGDVRTMQVAAQWMYYGGDVAEIALAVMLFAWWRGRSNLRTARRRM